jgi:hypothetical protein
MRRSRGTPEEIFNRAVAGSPKLTELLAGARPTMDFHATSDYSYFRRRLATERMLLLGDAGGFFDPIFSSGVYVGLSSARDAVRLLARAHRQGRALSPAECARYSRRIKQRAQVFKELIVSFYDNDAFAVFLCEKPPLGIDRGVNCIVAGDSRMRWPVWWRFQVFRLTCRLQKRFALVPRIDFTGMYGVETPATASSSA